MIEIPKFQLHLFIRIPALLARHKGTGPGCAGFGAISGSTVLGLVPYLTNCTYNAVSILKSKIDKARAIASLLQQS